MNKKEIEFYNSIVENFSPNDDIGGGATYILPTGKFIHLTEHTVIDNYLKENYQEYDTNRYTNTFLVDCVGSIKCSDGMSIFSEEKYLQLPKQRPTQTQFESLRKWLDTKNLDTISIINEDQHIELELDDLYADDVIHRIKQFYSTGKLK